MYSWLHLSVGLTGLAVEYGDAYLMGVLQLGTIWKWFAGEMNLVCYFLSRSCK